MVQKMSNYFGGPVITGFMKIFLSDPGFLTYMILLLAILGFGLLVKNMGVIRAFVFSGSVVGIAGLLWLNVISAAIDEAFRCMGGCP
jgi:hypothetical protein